MTGLTSIPGRYLKKTCYFVLSNERRVVFGGETSIALSVPYVSPEYGMTGRQFSTINWNSNRDSGRSKLSYHR